MAIEKGDFVELEFIGRVKETGEIFDLTNEKIAKEHNIYNEKFSYGPIIVCVGKGDVIKGLDEALEGKEVGKEYKVSIPPEKAFGKRNPNLLKLVPIDVFKKQGVTPIPGMKVEAYGLIGVVKIASGGRILVDFNHPLAGKEVEYEFKILRKVEDTKEKVSSILKLYFATEKPEIEIHERKLKIKNKFADEVKDLLRKAITERVKEIKEIEFE